jgi:hypothetical protein
MYALGRGHTTKIRCEEMHDACNSSNQTSQWYQRTASRHTAKWIAVASCWLEWHYVECLVKGVLAMQLRPKTFSQGTGFSLTSSWYLTIIICQHVRTISKKSYPNSQIKLSIWSHPLFPRWSSPVKGYWAPREYSGYSTMYSHTTCPINTWLWRHIQPLKCWTRIPWSCSRSH